MIKILAALFILYGSVLLLLFLFQRSVIYYPHKLDKQFMFPPYAAGQEEVFITCDDGCIINGLFIPGRAERPTVLIFHGNAGNITHRDFLLREFSRLGCAALLIDYHGYGKSAGTPTEQNLYLDAEAALSWLATHKKVTPDRVVLYGESLGCGVAVELATRHRFCGLVLVTAFRNLASVAGYHFPFNLFPANLILRDRFDNQAKIERVEAPLLFLHGTADEIIDAKESAALYELAKPPKQRYLIEGADHNGLPFHNPGRYWSIIGEWLEHVEGK
jgi:fermentation-respiration switch protein FrsA (DUF1100 family)